MTIEVARLQAELLLAAPGLNTFTVKKSWIKIVKHSELFEPKPSMI